VADHVKRTTQVLSIEEALNRFLTTKDKTSDYHSNDLARRLKRWAETRDRLQGRHGTIDGDVGGKRKIRRCLSPGGSAKMMFLRHSYGTYRAAILRNWHNLAEEMGNSIAIVRTYYDAVVSPSVAKLWWKIGPEGPENVVPMNAVT
jgi:hypothetical protein